MRRRSCLPILVGHSRRSTPRATRPRVLTTVDKPEYLGCLQAADPGDLRPFCRWLEVRAIRALREASVAIARVLERELSVLNGASERHLAI